MLALYVSLFQSIFATQGGDAAKFSACAEDMLSVSTWIEEWAEAHCADLDPETVREVADLRARFRSMADLMHDIKVGVESAASTDSTDSSSEAEAAPEDEQLYVLWFAGARNTAGDEWHWRSDPIKGKSATWKYLQDCLRGNGDLPDRVKRSVEAIRIRTYNRRAGRVVYEISHAALGEDECKRILTRLIGC